MNLGRTLLFGCGMLLPLQMCGTASQAAEPGPADTAAAATAPPSDSRERRAILDALREGWAWIEAVPQSRDGANRYEDVTVLLRQRTGRSVIQLLGPCGEEAQDSESGCDEDTDPGRLKERRHRGTTKEICGARSDPSRIAHRVPTTV